MSICRGENAAFIWNIENGKITRKIELNEDHQKATLSPDGKHVAKETSITTLDVEPLSGKSKTHQIETIGFEVNDIEYTPDGNYLLILSYGSPGIGAFESSPFLAAYDARDNYQLVGKWSIQKNGNECEAFCFSPDQKKVFVSNGKGTIWSADLPKLKNPKQVFSGSKLVGHGKMQISISPDMKWFAIGSFHEPVAMLNTKTWRPREKLSQHPAKMEHGYLLNQGKQVRSIGSGHVIDWDIATKKIIKRFELPPQTTPVSIRPDGRYAICADGAELNSSFSGRKPPPVKVVDLNTGKTVSSIQLDVNWGFRATTVDWLPNQQAIVYGNGIWIRFEYLTGKKLKTPAYDKKSDSHFFNGAGLLLEDGKTFLLWDTWGGKYQTNSIDVWTYNLETGKSSKVTKSKTVIRGGYNNSGLIPGGKNFYMGDPDIYVLSRKDGSLVKRHRFFSDDIMEVTFSSDGSMFAVVVGARKYLSERGVYDPKTPSVVRVHDAQTGKTLFAFPAPQRWINSLRFSSNGTHLLACGNSRLTVWKLPQGNGKEKQPKQK